MKEHSRLEPITETRKSVVNNKSMGSKPQKQEDVHFKIEWRELTYHQKPSRLSLFAGSGNKNKSGQTPTGNQPKRILDSLDGCFKSSQLSAILGPSGAGKSTFLSTLFGPKQESAIGQTRVTWYSGSGKNPNKAELEETRRPLRIASLPQHDHLLNHLTVYETLMFASRIKNASSHNKENPDRNFHRHNVRRVSKMLKLTECLDTRCGKLSGGQHKRVSIAQELLSEPDVIILDEPTSGLDAMTCLTTVQTLKSIVMKHPICIILTIHQPDVDVFGLFDHVYVIAQGGLAIYEGPPDGIEAHLDSVGLKMPAKSYNPARFIVENAFVAELPGGVGDESRGSPSARDRCAKGKQLATIEERGQEEQSESSEEDEYNEDSDKSKSYLQRSLLSFTDAISGKELSSGVVNKRDKKPLLSIGIQTLEGKLITSQQLEASNKLNNRLEEHATRMNLLRQMNTLQKSSYKNSRNLWQNQDTSFITSSSPINEKISVGKRSDYSSGKWTNERHSETDLTIRIGDSGICKTQSMSDGLSKSEANLSSRSFHSLDAPAPVEQSTDNDEYLSSAESSSSSSNSNYARELVESEAKKKKKQQVTIGKRCFDKRLSPKHSCSKRRDNPVWRHTILLAHRTWLSIVRDPIFFGIQACMHTIIPILLATIFGTVHEDGCPRIGSFDLVSFAYSDSSDMIQNTVSSIRESIGNIGILFFQMFVLSFSINCITALVFPLDMHVLLKEYRNGWYSMRAYFFGRTIADLPVPVALHTMAMAILYFMTGQPLVWWRFWLIVLLVILASLVAQSVGLAIGALLMKSSQSAVLAAAAIVAPFFALSGFIVRIHTLPWLAQAFAKTSYLYHLLNGFIIIRYGFGRCQCNMEDFEQNESHQIPRNLHTLASMWIGTYSNEYPNSTAALASVGESNRTNVDPNIDVVDKMMNAFKMANSYGHQISTCDDVLPYAMLDFNLRDQDIYFCFIVMLAMLIISRFVTFASIYYKVRSFA